MARRKKTNIGRRHKYYEKRIQDCRKNTPGRPRKRAIPSNEEPLDILILNEKIKLPSSEWSKCSSDGEVKLCKIQDIDGVLKVVRSLSIKNDGSWTLCIHDTKIINPATLPIFANFPLTLNEELAQDLLNVISEAKICPAHPDEHFIQFIESCKEKQLYSLSKTVLAYLDSFAPVYHKDKLYYKTVRSKGCQMLVSSRKCLSCAKVRPSI